MADWTNEIIVQVDWISPLFVSSCIVGAYSWLLYTFLFLNPRRRNNWKKSISISISIQVLFLNLDEINKTSNDLHV